MPASHNIKFRNEKEFGSSSHGRIIHLDGFTSRLDFNHQATSSLAAALENYVHEFGPAAIVWNSELLGMIEFHTYMLLMCFKQKLIYSPKQVALFSSLLGQRLTKIT